MTATTPTNEQIMEVLGLTATSTEQLCDRLRNIFAGRDWNAQPAPTLVGMGERVYAVNKANGWFDEDREFGDDIALLHSEVSEMFEAYRDHGFEDVTPSGGPKDEHGYRINKPEGFGSEAADVLVRLLDTDYRHGQGFLWTTLGDVEPYDEFDPALTVGEHIAILHVLISCITPNLPLNAPLAYLKTWCDHLNIDLQAEFERKLAYNVTRGYKHGNKRV